MCMMTEIFVPCLFGSIALEKSQRIGWKIYESNWIAQDKRFKQAFLIFIQRSTFPIHLSVNRVFFLDLGTFLKVTANKF